MEYHQILEIIERVVKEDPNYTDKNLFHEYALLVEDLNYDSVGLLALLVKLEITAEVDLPESSFTFTNIKTVKDLAGVLMTGGDGLDEDNPSDDVTVHCLVSCFCDSLKKAGVDFRPFYFGLWEAPFHYEAGRFSYHMRGDRHDSLVAVFEKLYGVSVESWFDYGVAKDRNIAAFQSKIHQSKSDDVVIAMFDLSLISCRENKFAQSEFPHYAIFEAGRHDGDYKMLDPDYRWQGDVSSVEVHESMKGDSIAGGYCYDRGKIKSASESVVCRHIEQVLTHRNNELTQTIKRCLEEHSGEAALYESKHLISALSEVPVLAIRKYAYEHAFAHYMISGILSESDFDVICDQIGQLAEGYKYVQYLAAKYSQCLSKSVLTEAFDKLDRLDSIETNLKGRLVSLHGKSLVGVSS